MPFGLKNMAATYQRCMLKCFGDLIRRTIEAYVDDIMVKSKRADQVTAVGGMTLDTHGRSHGLCL